MSPNSLLANSLCNSKRYWSKFWSFQMSNCSEGFDVVCHHVYVNFLRQSKSKEGQSLDLNIHSPLNVEALEFKRKGTTKRPYTLLHGLKCNVIIRYNCLDHKENLSIRLYAIAHTWKENECKGNKANIVYIHIYDCDFVLYLRSWDKTCTTSAYNKNVTYSRGFFLVYA